MPVPRSTAIPAAVAAAVLGAVASFASLGVAGLTGIPVVLFLVAGPAALFLAPGPALWTVVGFLAGGGFIYGLYTYVLLRRGSGTLVWVFACHGLGAALAAATVGPK